MISNPEDWSKWIHQFECFLSVSGLKEKGDKSQVNSLIYCTGEEADDIYAHSKCWRTTKRSISEREVDSHLDKRESIIYESKIQHEKTGGGRV